ncbi:MAG TPA: glycoside hydrolase family 3 protein [Terriglobales bacterium]|nr:glycoside hydrolase family 3 protein [Terriglobales bacterium]
MFTVMRVRLVVLFFLLLVPSSLARDKFQQPGPVRLTRGGEKWAERTLRGMSLEEKVGQMFMLKAPAQFLNLESPEYLALRDAIDRYHVGGFLLTVRSENGMVYRNQPYEAAMFTNQLQRESDVPLIFAADFERGPSMRFDGTTPFPHAMAFGAAGRTEYVEAFARVVAEESRALGVVWNFFPVADVNSEPANPIINTRAFGEDPEEVSRFVTAYIRAARANGLLTTAKHFPGHGDTETDSHIGIARVSVDRAHLEAVELVPFRQAIAAGVDSIMTAHVTVPALEPAADRVATTSPGVVTGLLKSQLGFQGVVVTDAMEMHAITRLYANGNGRNPGRAAVDAVKAGQDLITIPANIETSYRALLDAVRSGEISEERIDASVRKLLRLKASVGLDRAKLVDIHQLSRRVARPQSLALAQEVSDAAVTLVRSNGTLLPLRAESFRPAPPPAPQGEGTVTASDAYFSQGGGRLLAVIFADDLRSEYGRVLQREIRARVPQAEVLFVDLRTAAALAPRALEAAQQATAVVAAVFSSPTAGRRVLVNGQSVNSVSLAEAPRKLLGDLLQNAGARTVVVALGNPYLGADFPAVENYLCTYSGVPTSEISAAKALFGEMAVRGRLPVTIPGVAARGAGIDLEPTAPQAATAAPPAPHP